MPYYNTTKGAAKRIPLHRPTLPHYSQLLVTHFLLCKGDQCVTQCKNNPNCDYLSHATVKGDTNRECNLRWKEWNKNTSYPTDRPCVPKEGKQNCDICLLYNVKNIPGTNQKQQIHLAANDKFVTLTKNNIQVSNK